MLCRVSTSFLVAKKSSCDGEFVVCECEGPRAWNVDKNYSCDISSVPPCVLNHIQLHIRIQFNRYILHHITPIHILYSMIWQFQVGFFGVFNIFTKPSRKESPEFAEIPKRSLITKLPSWTRWADVSPAGIPCRDGKNPLVSTMFVPSLKVSLTQGYLVVKVGGWPILTSRDPFWKGLLLEVGFNRRTTNWALAKSVLPLPVWTWWHGCFFLSWAFPCWDKKPTSAWISDLMRSTFRLMCWNVPLQDDQNEGKASTCYAAKHWQDLYEILGLQVTRLLGRWINFYRFRVMMYQYSAFMRRYHPQKL